MAMPVSLMCTRWMAGIGLCGVVCTMRVCINVGSAVAQRTAEILPFYNAERTANGLPPVTQVNTQEEVGCANHLGYMWLNGRELEHGETPGKPGYTPEGNYENGAGGSEVLSDVPGWSAGHDPWETAPIHAFLMFDPTVVSTGYADNAHFVCQRMWSSRFEGVPGMEHAPVFYAWTFMHGRSQVPYEERAAEVPYTPQELVGIAGGKTTGPNIMVYSAGDSGTPQTATLTAADGSLVPVSLVNADSRSSVGNGAEWFEGGGIVIPNSPLLPLSTYTANVTWLDGGQTTVQTFTFTTAAHTNAISLRIGYRFVRVGRSFRVRERIYVGSQAPNPAVTISEAGGHTRTVRMYRQGGASAFDSQWMAVRPGKSYTGCVTSGGGSYITAHQCERVRVPSTT